MEAVPILVFPVAVKVPEGSSERPVLGSAVVVEGTKRPVGLPTWLPDVDATVVIEGTKRLAFPTVVTVGLPDVFIASVSISLFPSSLKVES